MGTFHLQLYCASSKICPEVYGIFQNRIKDRRKRTVETGELSVSCSISRSCVHDWQKEKGDSICGTKSCDCFLQRRKGFFLLWGNIWATTTTSQTPKSVRPLGQKSFPSVLDRSYWEVLHSLHKNIFILFIYSCWVFFPSLEQTQDSYERGRK